MIFGRSSFLGLSISDRAIVCAEVGAAGDRRTVRRLAVFPFTAETPLENASSTGQALASFLREHRFSSSHAVVGVPARWLIATERELPPVADDQARAMLRLQAERLSAAESGELVCDYVGQADARAAKKVLLVAMQRTRLDQVENLLESAGLSVLAVTSSALMLAAASNVSQDLPLVLIERQGAEVVWRRGGETRMLRHVSVQANGNGAPAIAPLSLELGRAVSLAPGGNGAARELLLWDGVGLDADHVGQLSSRLGFKLLPGDPQRTLNVEPGQSSSAEVQQYGPAVSLALAGGQRKLLPLDFKKSRLSPPRRKRIDRNTRWGIIAGGAIVLLVIGLYVAVHLRQSDLSRLTTQIEAIKDQKKSAESLLDRVNYSSGFYEQRPKALECLRDITMAFRDEDRMWVTSLSLREERSGLQAGAGANEPVRKGQIIGRSVDQKTVIDFHDRLIANRKAFDEVKLSFGESGGRSKDTNFTISFTYVAKE